MSNHNLTLADYVYQGAAYYERFHTGALPKRGLPVDLPIYTNLGAITAADRDGLVQSVDPANNATLTLRSTVTGMTNTGGVVTLDTPRNVTLYSAADQSAKSITVTGTDQYGAALVESITGPDGTGATKTAQGVKAFKTISSIVVVGDMGTIEVGFGPRIGLPYYVSDVDRVIPLINGRAAAQVHLPFIITAIGTAQDTAAVSPTGGVITKLVGTSAAANGTAASTVTVTNATLEVGVLAFSDSYTALAAVEDTTLLNTRLAANDVLKATTDGTGDGAGQAHIAALVSQAVVTAGVTTAATATTGDVRGYVDFGFGPNGTNVYGLLIMPGSRQTKDAAFGVAQYGG